MKSTLRSWLRKSLPEKQDVARLQCNAETVIFHIDGAVVSRGALPSLLPSLLSQAVVRARLHDGPQPSVQVLLGVHRLHRSDHPDHGVLDDVQAKRFIASGGAPDFGAHLIEPPAIQTGKRLGVTRSDRRG